MRVFLIAAFALSFLTLGATRASAADGKAVFTSAKCDKCHEVSSLGLKSTKDKDEVIDLAGTAKGGHDAAWYASYLKKEIEADSRVKKGEKKKHKKEWAGSDEDLKALSQWLTTLK